jgi:hypothetical protein
VANRVVDIDRGFKKLTRNISRLIGTNVKVGWEDPKVATRAAANEFGTARIPARPFIRRALDGRRNVIGAAMDKRITNVIDDLDYRGNVEAMGVIIKEAIQRVIDDSRAWAVPNAPATVARKGFQHPLVDTGEMQDSVVVKVEEG